MPPRVLFVQLLEAGAYPPIIHASTLMADAGWDVIVLNAPFSGMELQFPDDRNIKVRNVSRRPSFVVRKSDYVRYCATAARLALMLRPNLVYASDPLGAAPGLLTARLVNADLVYHEHDTPQP